MTDEHDRAAVAAAPAWIGWVSLAIVLAVALGAWSYLTQSNEVDEPALTASERLALDACMAAWRSVDAEAVVPPRPVFGDLVSWPTGSGLSLQGVAASGSCVLGPDSQVLGLTANGRDVVLPK